MKNYEKAYKEALEKAKGTINYYKEHNRGDEAAIEDLEEIFPELKESEDERIREAIIRIFTGESNYTSKEDANKYIAWLEKQGEKKPINDTDEEIVKARLWDITKDAKDGDVLYSLDSKQPFIFKHRKPNEQAAVYCGINTYGKFFIGNTKDCIITTDKYIPATKAQRDILLKAMADAGYEWDAEKKELKLLISNGGDFESPTWSEDDEEILKNLIDYFSLDDGLRLPTEETIDWLKSLKERLS